MLDLQSLPPWTASGARIAVVALLTVVALLVARAAITVGLRQLLVRRSSGTDMDEHARLERERRVGTIGRLAGRIAGGVIVVIATLMVLGEVGVDVGPAVAGLGVVGVAVGFGAQSLVRDWFAGVFIVIENQYSEGDVVRIADVQGVVEELSLRRTTLRDIDGTLHSVPNGQIAVASNRTRLWLPLSVRLRLAEHGDSATAVDAINQVGRAMKLDPQWGETMVAAPAVSRYRADGAIEVAVRVRATDEERVRAELQERIGQALASEKVRLGD